MLFSGVWSPNQHYMQSPTNFLRLPGNGFVFSSENFPDYKNALYVPIKQDLMINLRGMEQLSFDTGVFFTADDSQQYDSKKEGKCCMYTNLYIYLTLSTALNLYLDSSKILFVIYVPTWFSELHSGAVYRIYH